jgi:hypothetical protein
MIAQGRRGSLSHARPGYCRLGRQRDRRSRDAGNVVRTPSCGNAVPGRRTGVPPSPQCVSPSLQSVGPSPQCISPSLQSVGPSPQCVSPSLQCDVPSLQCDAPSPHVVGPSPQCVAPSPHVWRSLSAMRRPVAARVAVPVRNASARRRTCGGRCPQCVAPSPQVRRCLSATRPHRVSRAPRTRGVELSPSYAGT